MRTPCSQLDPSRGVLVVLAASSTPGVARTSSCNSCWNSAQRWGGKLDCQYPRKPTVMPPSRMPGSNVIKLRKLRTKSSAATSRTSETEIWVTTIRRCREKRSRPAVTPRPLAFMAAAGCHRGGANRRQRGGGGESQDAPASGKQKPPPIHAGIQIGGRTFGGNRPDQHAAQSVRESDPQRGSGGGQQGAFREQLPHQAGARGS